MSQFRAISTITWKFESDKSFEECLEHAKKQLDMILDCSPKGGGFEGFNVQVDIAPMKEKSSYIHLASFPVDEILSHVTSNDEKKEFLIDGTTYSVRMNSDRYFVFRQSRTCAACGLEGTQMILDLNSGTPSPHFNLYGEEDGRLVLMTKDHIVPKSKGGRDELTNYECMCCVCNNLKGSYNLSYEQIRKLRVLYKNDGKIPKKELRNIINRAREEFDSPKSQFPHS